MYRINKIITQTEVTLIPKLVGTVQTCLRAAEPQGLYTASGTFNSVPRSTRGTSKFDGKWRSVGTRHRVPTAR